MYSLLSKLLPKLNEQLLGLNGRRLIGYRCRRSGSIGNGTQTFVWRNIGAIWRLRNYYFTMCKFLARETMRKHTTGALLNYYQV